MGDDRGKIMEKRSSMRGWHERGGKKPRKNEILGIALIAVIFLAVIATALIGNGSPDTGGIEPSQKKTLTLTTVPHKKTTPTTTLSPIPAPSIRISSPQNVTYDTSIPKLDFTVIGSGLDTVFLSIDGGENITVPHDDTLAKIDFAKGNPLFIEDFSGGAGRWKESGNWRVEDGKYVTTGGTSSFGDPGWNDYIIEAKTKVVSGKDVSIDLRWDGQNNYYRVQTNDNYGNFKLHKMDSKGFTNIFLTRLPGIESGDWHLWKIIANGSKIQAYIDGAQYIEYVDSNDPYLNGNFRLRVVSTNAEYDYVHVYKPLSNTPHNLTLFTNNTAGNASYATVFFTVNATAASTGDEDKVGGMKETISKEGLNVILERFDIYKEISVYPSAYKRAQYADTKRVSAVTLTIENTGDTKKPFKLDPAAVILDEHGNQYGMQIYKYMKNSAGLDDQIEQTTIYPGVEREGVIYFEPNVKISAKKVTFFLYINGVKYEFVFNPFM